MAKPQRRIAAVLFCIALAALPARGDDLLELRDGSAIRGDVVEWTAEAVKLRSGKRELLVPTRFIRAATMDPERHGSLCPHRCGLCDRLFSKVLDRMCAIVRKSPSDRPIPLLPTGLERAPHRGVRQTPPDVKVQVVTASVLGLVLLGEGAAEEADGPRREALDRLERYVRKHFDRRAALGTWRLCFGLLFLAERQIRDPDPDRWAVVEQAALLLERARIGRLGWGHDLHPSYYGPLVAVTIWCVAALQSAERAGVAVDRAGLATACAGLRASIGGDGGARYFVPRSMRERIRASRVINHATPGPAYAGRTGGVAWALLRGGEWREDCGARNFFRQTMARVPHGHATRVMALAWGALGAAALGETEHAAFWRRFRAVILKAPGRGGLFAPQRWLDSPVSLPIARAHLVPGRTEHGERSWDDKYGPGWVTPWMLLVWQVARGRCPLVATPGR